MSIGKTKAERAFHRAVIDLAEESVSRALALLTGHFVGLTLEVIRRNGEEADGEIRIAGGQARDITIHAAKGSPAAAMTESIRWHPADKALPDADTMVMIVSGADAEVWMGYTDGEQWYLPARFPTGDVAYWAHLPGGPK